METDGGKYKVKYDGVEFEAWLTSNQFKVVNEFGEWTTGSEESIKAGETKNIPRD